MTERFSAVPWLPSIEFSMKTIMAQEVEAYHGANTILPFSQHEWTDWQTIFPTYPDVLPIADLTDEEILSESADFDPNEGDEVDQYVELAGRALLYARKISRQLRAQGTPEHLVERAVKIRSVYLNALHEGAPPVASRLQEISSTVPMSFVHLGKSLPTQEIIDLLPKDKPVVELGAGLGLHARALAQAGYEIEATDLAGPLDPQGIGIAHPVTHRIDGRTIGRIDATILIMWPDAQTDWMLHPFLNAEPGDLIALSSPELDAALNRPDRMIPHLRQQWSHLFELLKLLQRDYLLVGSAPIVPAMPGSELSTLRLWQRNPAKRKEVGRRSRGSR